MRSREEVNNRVPVLKVALPDSVWSNPDQIRVSGGRGRASNPENRTQVPTMVEHCFWLAHSEGLGGLLVWLGFVFSVFSIFLFPLGKPEI
jgi:hypothetical protein